MELAAELSDRSAWPVSDECSIAKTLALLGTRVAFLVVRECFYGTSRFDDFVERIGTSAPTMSRALKQLESAGVVMRAPYREPGSRPRDEYRLTEAGQDLLPALLALAQWGDKHAQDGPPPLVFTSGGDGKRITVSVTTADVEPLRADDIEIQLPKGMADARGRRVEPSPGTRSSTAPSGLPKPPAAPSTADMPNLS
jgi:DNA-binding HxlR family transcriptional regulator